MDPQQMAQAMKAMGIKSRQLHAQQVVIKLQDKELLIKNPQVTEIDMKGIKTYQVMGEAEEIATKAWDEQDIEMVMQKTGKSRGETEAALKKHNGDIAAAIMELGA